VYTGAALFPAANGFMFHIVLMPIAFAGIAPLGAITWRVGAALKVDRALVKAVHAILMSVASIVSVVGIIYMYQTHESKLDSETASYGIAHFESVHSWIGIVAAGIFVLNSIFGLALFYGPASQATRKAYMPVHIFLGMVAVFLTLTSIPLGILSYVGRGTGEPGTSHTVAGGAVATNLYKIASLLVVALGIAIGLTYFVSKPGWAHATAKREA